MTGGLVLIGGSTASGKSALALALAERTGGAIVNADSVQLYRDLPILTARPDAAELARAEHHLYGILDAHEASSVAAWLARLQPVLTGLQARGRLAILTGGTGLYFKALLEGLPAIPEIPPDLRAGLRADPAPTEALHARLVRLDPRLAARLEPGDRQRILRGLEVALATGRPLTAWQADPPVRPPLPGPRAGIALLPPADRVLPRIEQRLDAMLAAGLLAELAAFRARAGDQPTPLAHADGVAEFGAHLDGRIDLAEARRLTVVKVRRYAKRQRTFFRGQLARELGPRPVAVGPDNVETLATALLQSLRAAT
ncbi:MAG: tRNA (adenosine(37)-N6)-dimethylallyltransferase MiaA [Geminicoccaceae bacterium]